MANALPPIPTRSAMADDQGMVTNIWFVFFREVSNRIGGFTAQSNAELLTRIEALEAQATSGLALGQGRAL